MAEVKRVFVGGLVPEITEKELTERFQRFCEVLNVQIKKREVHNSVDKIFAYVNVKASEENLKKCFSVYNKTKWKGSELRLQMAKENFLSRLEKERENGFQVEENNKFSKRDTVKLHNPFESLPDPSTPEMKGCVPGTKISGERNWVVGKYGRVLPVVYVRNKDRKHVVKVDPSKFCHNLKKIKCGEEIWLSKLNNLTLEIEDIDNELSRKRKGEFSKWKPSCIKHKKFDYDTLRDGSNNIRKLDYHKNEPNFEIVPEKSWLSKCSHCYTSDDSNSDSDYTSLKEAGSKSFLNKSHVPKSVSGFCNIEQAGLNSSCNGKPLSVGVEKVIGISCKGVGNIFDAASLNNIMDGKETKPKIQHFGGTKMLYATPNLDKRESKEALVASFLQQSSSKTSVKGMNVSSKTPNDQIYLFIGKDVNLENDKSELEILKSKPLEQGNTGNICAPSADADEFVLRSKCMSSPESLSSSGTDRFLFNKPEKKLPLQIKVNEFSSGLLNREILDGDITDDVDEYSYESEDSDFEKFAKRELKRMASKSNVSDFKPAVTGSELFTGTMKRNRTGLDTEIQSEDGYFKRVSDVALHNGSPVVSNRQKAEIGRSSQGKNVELRNKSTSGKAQGMLSENSVLESTYLNRFMDSMSLYACVGKSKKTEVESNQKRLESLKRRQEENKSKKSAIKKALESTFIDSKPQFNKKIVFNSDSDSSQSEDSVVIDNDDDDDNDKVPSRNEYEKDVKRKKYSQIDRQTSLFDSSEEYDDDARDEFKIRPEFKGKSGQKRMELQSQYGNDERFKLDRRFMDSDEETEDEETIELLKDDEKTRLLKMLEEVIGMKMKTREKEKKFKDVRALHFDPTKNDHLEYEIKATDKRVQEKEKKPADRKVDDNTEKNESSKLPSISKEKFFEVSNSLTDAFKSRKEASSLERFSLLDTFGSYGKDNWTGSIAEAYTEEKLLPHKPSMFPWKQMFSEDSNSGSDQEDQHLENFENGSDDERPEQPVVFTCGKSFFFFQENDERISEGVKKLCRQENYNSIKQKWLDKRSTLVEAYRIKHKRLVRKMKINRRN